MYIITPFDAGVSAITTSLAISNTVKIFIIANFYYISWRIGIDSQDDLMNHAIYLTLRLDDGRR